MIKLRHPSRVIVPTKLLAGVLLTAMLLVAAVPASLAAASAPPLSQGPQSNPNDVRLTLADWELIGTVNFPTGTMFAGTQVGGLSSITYDEHRGVFYALSDDQGQINPVRFYTLAVDLSDGQLDAGDIAFTGVTTLLDASGQPYAPGSLDPEGLALAHSGQLFMSSEGFAARGIPPFVNRYNLDGELTKEAAVPEKFLPVSSAQGVRQNLAFESLNVSPDARFLYTAAEGALVQDGPAAAYGVPSTARILQYRLAEPRPLHEYVYPVNSLPEQPVPPTAFGVNGLVELLPLDNFGAMLAMERGFSVGAPGSGNTVHLYEINTEGATDVSGDFALPASYEPVAKRFILDVETDLGIEPDNLEGMAFGAPLPDGRLPLVLVSDNNFAANQVTQFIVLAVTLAER